MLGQRRRRWQNIIQHWLNICYPVSRHLDIHFCDCCMKPRSNCLPFGRRSHHIYDVIKKITPALLSIQSLNCGSILSGAKKSLPKWPFIRAARWGLTAILFLLTFVALRCTRVSFLLHGVEYLVAILSLVLVRETDDSHLSAMFILFVHITKLKGLAQAKIIKKSVILFWLLNMTIWCKHVHRLEVQSFFNFCAAHSPVRLDIETKFLICNYWQPCQKLEIREFRLYI